MELLAMEGLDISFPCNQPQPNVIKPEHLGVVGGEVHIKKSLSRKHISTSRYVRGPEVEGVLVQSNKPLTTYGDGVLSVERQSQ